MSTPNPDAPIMGYEAIAKATGKRLNQSVSVVTAKRWAKPGERRLRLPVFIYPNNRAYMLPTHLEVFAIAWLAGKPSGAKLPGVRHAEARLPGKSRSEVVDAR